MMVRKVTRHYKWNSEKGCWREKPMEPKAYQRMRAAMIIIEMEMDEVVE